MNKNFRKECAVYIKLLKQISKCRRYKNSNTKKCKFNNYLKYFGAEVGICKMFNCVKIISLLI